MPTVEFEAGLIKYGVWSLLAEVERGRLWKMCCALQT